MNVLCNGDENEKNEFSFKLIDMNESGSVSFEEFSNHFTKVVMHWSSLVNNHVRLEKSLLRQIFDEIDTDRTGQISFKEYSAALQKNPDLLDWFKILNHKKLAPTPTENLPVEDKVK